MKNRFIIIVFFICIMLLVGALRNYFVYDVKPERLYMHAVLSIFAGIFFFIIKKIMDYANGK
jgi:hypothetical protein